MTTSIQSRNRSNQKRWSLFVIKRWQIANWLIILLIFSAIFSVVSIPLVPISPQVFLPFIFLGVCWKYVRNTLRYLLKIKELWWIIILYAIVTVGSFLTVGFSYNTFAEAGRNLAALVTIIVVASYASSDSTRLRRATSVLLISLLISSLWFVLELSLVEPFVTLRRDLYKELYENDLLYASSGFGLAANIRSGLTPFTHLLGYQLAACLPLLLTAHFDRRWKIPVWLSIGGFGVAVMGLYFSSQRSALAAACLSSFLFLSVIFKHRLRTFILMVAVILPIIAGLTWFLVSTVTWSTESLGQESLLKKLVGEAGQADLVFRMRLQARAVELLWLYPFGLPAAGRNWSEDGFWYVYNRSLYQVDSSVLATGGLAVHNNYIVMALDWGLPFFLVTLVFLCGIFISALRLIWLMNRFPPDMQVVSAGIAATVVGLFSVQSLTHNAGILTAEPVCLSMLGLLFAVNTIRRRLVVQSRLRNEQLDVNIR